MEVTILADDDGLPSLAALYLRNREAMFRAALAILRNQHDAEDAVSTAVVNVSARFADGHVPDNPNAYLVQSVRNAALDRLRVLARRQAAPQESSLENHNLSQAGGSREPADIVDTGPDVLDQIIERQRSHEISSAIQRTLDQLASREAAMLSSLLDGHTRIQIGEQHNLTGQRVGQLLKKPISDLLEELAVDQVPSKTRQTEGRS